MPETSAADECVNSLKCESNVLSLSKGSVVHFVYILQCRDDSYYVGSAHDVAKRFEVHRSGDGPVFTASRLPVRLIYQEPFSTPEEAVRREKQLKGWSRAKKEALISGDMKSLSELAAGRQTRQ
jgi:putative endonuclease